MPFAGSLWHKRAVVAPYHCHQLAETADGQQLEVELGNKFRNFIRCDNTFHHWNPGRLVDITRSNIEIPSVGQISSTSLSSRLMKDVMNMLCQSGDREGGVCVEEVVFT